ncbi:MAG: glutamine synthetase family protein [Nanoarchaeota archaeon]|nr:glutamine synthetase family protein [Nanoarchaeota archaeon]MBU1704555.1 glutamine synthetase family protein [Nanoarchaeota archaeon]
MPALNAKTKEDVIELCNQYKVKFIRLWFTDILGQLKSFSITMSELDAAFEDGIGFDGSSIEGYRDIEESDMIARPDPTTFQLLPWQSIEDKRVARMVCDITTPDGKPYEGDPRYILKRQLERAKKMGYTFYMGPELEYFYFKDDKGTEIVEKAGYFDLEHLDITAEVRKETVLALEGMGMTIECDHHEVAPSQHEIDIRYCEALQMADHVQTYKSVVKEIARKHGLYATFLPKPIFKVNGSGMHTHQSFFEGDKNAFFSKDDPHHISVKGKQYIAGILRHAREFCAITNQSVNSYKRLVPGYEAPVYVAWSTANRSAMVRIPNFAPGKEKATRMELRCPDPVANPYLAFAVMIASGLEGIEKGYKLGEPTNKNIFHLTDEQKKELDIPSLPGSLGEAIELTAGSDVVKKALGEHIFNRFIEIKRREWDEYRMWVSDYEIKKLLPRL